MDEGQTNEVGTPEINPYRPVKILIAEDTPFIKRLLEAVAVRVGGLSVSSTVKASEALDLLRKAQEEGDPFELVLTDLGLEDDPRGGLEIAKVVKAEGLAKLVEMLTSNSGEVTPKLMEEYGINKVHDKEQVAGIVEYTRVLSQARDAIRPMPPQVT